MLSLLSRKHAQGYGTVLVALIGAAAVATSIGYEARLQGQTGERNESLKGYLQARELASERVMMMLAAIEKAGVTPVVLNGVNAASADTAILELSPGSVGELGSQIGVDLTALGRQLSAQVQAASSWKNSSVELETRVLGVPTRVVRDSNGIPVRLDYTLRIQGKGYYFCPSAGSKTGCATGEAAADMRWKIPLQVAALPVLPPSVTNTGTDPSTSTGGGGPDAGGGSTSAGSSSDPCAALAPQNTSSNTTSASSVAIATNSGTLTCTSGNVASGGSISVGGNATNSQGTSTTQGSATQNSNNIHSTTSGSGSFASNTTTNLNGTQTQSSGSAQNVHNVSGASGLSGSAGTSTPPVTGSSSDQYYQASLGGSLSGRTLHPWDQP